MIDKTQLLQQVLASLRVAREPGAPGRADAPTVAARGTDSGAAPAHVRHGASLEQRLRRRIGEIARDDPQRRRKLLRLTIESCLAGEWGEDLSADPAFHALVDQVVQQMDNDPALRPLIDETLSALAQT